MQQGAISVHEVQLVAASVQAVQDSPNCSDHPAAACFKPVQQNADSFQPVSFKPNDASVQELKKPLTKQSVTQNVEDASVKVK